MGTGKIFGFFVNFCNMSQKIISFFVTFTTVCTFFGSNIITGPPWIELVSKELNHFAAILHVYAWGLNFMKNFFFQKEKGNTFTLLIICIVKSLQKEQNSTNLLLWPPIWWNKSAITPKWFNFLDTNSRSDS